MADSYSAYAVLTELFVEFPTPRILHELSRLLAASTDAAIVRVWRARAGSILSAELSWPTEAENVPDVVASKVDSLSGTDASVLILDGARLLGAVTLTSSPGHVITDDDRRGLRETADCVLLLWRRDDLNTTVHQQNRHTSQLADELAESGRRLTRVRELERRRVATEMITLSTSRFVQLHEQVRQIDALLAAGLPPGASLARFRELLNDLIEDFRVMVRGIHSQVLQTRGPRAALTEVVAGLSRPARITGTVPARVDPELAASLYHLAAAALQVLSDGDRWDRPAQPRDQLEVHLSHVLGQLGVLITGGTRISAAGLRAALTVDKDRLAALGGGLRIEVEDAVLRLRAWLPDRLEPAALAPTPAPSSLPVGVRGLALALAASYGDSPGSSLAWDLVTRMDGPVRLGVQGLGLQDGQSLEGQNGWLTELSRRLPDVVLVPYPSGDDNQHSQSDLDMPDAVLRPAQDRPREGADLLLLGAGILVRSAPWAELPELLLTELVARTDLLRARSALAALIVLLRDIPLNDSAGRHFRYELEELSSGAHQLAELEVIAKLRTGALNLGRSQVRNAERLLGCAGTSPHERLGLPGSTEPTELINAASEQLDRWRRLAEGVAVGRQHRQACSVIVQSCEGLLAEMMAASPKAGTG